MSSALDTQTEHTSFLLPGIVVLNYNYFPDSAYSASKVGATAFAMSAVQVLKDVHAFCGMILYKRQEDLKWPSITMEPRNSVLCATVSFHFGMQAMLLENAISTASELLAAGSARPPMLYYQTDTLLDYHPNRLPFCVTHHGPFLRRLRKPLFRRVGGSGIRQSSKSSTSTNTAKFGNRTPQNPRPCICVPAFPPSRKVSAEMWHRPLEDVWTVPSHQFDAYYGLPDKHQCDEKLCSRL